jgi:5,10-methylene-tetrahydrofolate dehydrogenase/methenyl tetrahydrofolate cyclohydrolase
MNSRCTNPPPYWMAWGVSEVVLNYVRWVIDIGINRLENGKLVGDVDFEAVA